MTTPDRSAELPSSTEGGLRSDMQALSEVEEVIARFKDGRTCDARDIKALVGEIERLRASAPTENEADLIELLAQCEEEFGYRANSEFIRRKSDNARVSLVAVLAAISRARSASVTDGLTKYAQHLSGCPSHPKNASPWPSSGKQPPDCDCGLNQALRATRASVTDAPVKVCPDGREFLRELAETMGVIDVCADSGESIPIKDVMAKMLVAAREYRDSLETTPPAHGEGGLREAIEKASKLLDENWKECPTFACQAYNILERALSHAPSPPQEDVSGLVEASDEQIDAAFKALNEYYVLNGRICREHVAVCLEAALASRPQSTDTAQPSSGSEKQKERE